MQMPVQKAQAGVGVGDAYQQQAQNELNSWMQQYQQASNGRSMLLKLRRANSRFMGRVADYLVRTQTSTVMQGLVVHFPIFSAGFKRDRHGVDGKCNTRVGTGMAAAMVPYLSCHLYLSRRLLWVG